MGTRKSLSVLNILNAPEKAEEDKITVELDTIVVTGDLDKRSPKAQRRPKPTELHKRMYCYGIKGCWDDSWNQELLKIKKKTVWREPKAMRGFQSHFGIDTVGLPCGPGLRPMFPMQRSQV